MTALPEVSESFKPRILAALGHRRAEEAADLCAAAIGSKNIDTALAGMKATSRIGKKPAVEVKPPNYDSLSGWQKVEYSDSILRYADDQASTSGAAGGHQPIEPRHRSARAQLGSAHAPARSAL